MDNDTETLGFAFVFVFPLKKEVSGLCIPNRGRKTFFQFSNWS